MVKIKVDEKNRLIAAVLRWEMKVPSLFDTPDAAELRKAVKRFLKHAKEYPFKKGVRR